jgi:MGT family glycosyltransferase
LVISLGGGGTPESLPQLPGKPLVVGYAPQLELLQKATLTITHAGLNTTLESLSNGVPMVAIPITNDQPGVAARIAWTGVGEVVPLSRLSVPRLRGAVQRVLTEDSYKQNALRLQAAIRQAGGVSRAADIIEQAISTGKPVLA